MDAYEYAQADREMYRRFCGQNRQYLDGDDPAEYEPEDPDIEDIEDVDAELTISGDTLAERQYPS